MHATSSQNLRLWSVVIAMVVIFQSVAVANGPLWSSTYEQALQQAKAEKKPVLLHFYGDRCLPCLRMEKSVLKAPAVRGQLGKDVVTVKVHIDQRRDLAEKYRVQTIPTDVFVDAQGRVLSLSIGFVDQQNYLTKANKVSTRYREAMALLEKRKNQGHEVPDRPLPRLVAKVPVKANQVSSTPLGLDGFCPISLFKNREWIEGTAQYEAEHEGYRYQFVTEKMKQDFEANPSRYVPQLLGCDAVVMWETGRAVTGTTDHGAFYQGELYLFSSDENRQLFKLDPSRYTRERQAVKIDDVEISVFR